MFTLTDIFLLIMPIFGGLLGAFFSKRNNPLGLLIALDVTALFMLTVKWLAG